jgi:hypothetical protein
MAISYTLSIVQNLIYPDTDYLGGVTWQMTGTDDINSSSMQGLVRFDKEDPTDAYIPFENLSQDTIISWTRNALGEDTINSIQTDIANNIAAMVV